ncbi:MAG: PQQ-dependent sugar dehydrogenase [Phaeodactylibacter sp.]|nr:PQQ-dependent sugar dehydrogenase [Phaeodactylibacter sp.]MCB9273345.1 PQQ-dependent sugar dehydrogenase [Lewinellaceae bacterium]
MKPIILIAFLFAAFFSTAQNAIQLEVYASGFSQPVDITNAGDERLFVVEKAGYISIIDGDGHPLPQPFLDIDSRVNSVASERGLLGLAFHPDYENNGYFFVNYTNNDGDTRISRFSRSAADPNLADPNSELILLEVDQPYSNHNAGDLNFGPDGYLYFGLGDGGLGGDPLNSGQTRMALLGKMHRIDVDNGNPYAIPPDNPFVDDDSTADEIWALGLRNPWRFSFDRLTGDMWIGDVGQDSWEEVDFQPASSAGGENYGWRCYEGLAPYNSSGCGPSSSYVSPIHVYANNNSVGCSITGGFVYRGSAFPALYGKYIYADYCSGRFWSLEPDGQGGWVNTELINTTNSEFVSFGENKAGELFVAGIGSGNIFRVRVNCAAQPIPVITAEDNVLTAPAGYVSYQWLLGGQPIEDAAGAAFTAEESGSYSVQVADGNGCTLASEAVEIIVNSLESLGLRALSVSPNPFDGNFRLEFAALQPGNFRIRLQNAEGQVVWQRNSHGVQEFSEQIELPGLASGAYLLIVDKDGRQIVRPLVKQ